MWRCSLIHLLLMLAGFGAGGYAWTTKFGQGCWWAGDCWIGELIGLVVGWVLAAILTRATQRSPTPATLTSAATLPQTPPPPAPKPQPVAKAPARSEAITLLAALQREARFVDFIQESLDGYSDAQIGAVVRDVHRDCAAVFKRVFALRPTVSQDEGAEVEVPAGFDAGRWRLTGNVTGEPPFHGRLVHPGWEATTCELPSWVGTATSAKIVAPAEVELA